MLPDCMQGPSEPCAGYTAQSASIAALEAELAAADARYSRLAGWYGDECDRRRAAEELLHEADKDWVAMGYAGWLEFNKRLLAHFARYKD